MTDFDARGFLIRNVIVQPILIMKIHFLRVTSVLGLFFAATAFQPLDASTRVFNKEGLIGATAGGIAGGVIGHQSGHKVEGAVIGAVGGYALGTNMHRQKSKNKDLRRERAGLHHEVAEQKQALEETGAALRQATTRPPLTREQEQQLVLQAYPLYRMHRPGSE